MRGRVINKIQGYYYVDDGNVLHECKLRGILKKNNDKYNCIVGDYVEISEDNSIINVEERKNFLTRPIVSNIDIFAIQMSVKNPEIDLNRLNILILHSFFHKIQPIVIINKIDYITEEELAGLKNKLIFLDSINVKYFFISTTLNLGIDDLSSYLQGKTTAIGGPSGVGKSTLINMLQSEIKLKTGDTSSRLKRGKHTTRDSNLLKLNVGGYIIDTPGFSSIDLPEINSIEQLISLFPEFKNINDCKFLNCSHTHEPNCKIKENVENGKINNYRYDFYKYVYSTLKERGSL